MEKIVKCGIVGGFVLFIWAAILYTLIPWHGHQMKSFSNEKSVRNTIASNIDGSGLYMLPNLEKYQDNPQQMEDAKARMREGPFVVAAVRANGMEPGIKGNMIASLIFKIVSAGLASWLLLRTYPQHAPNFIQAVRFMIVVGILVGLSTTAPCFIWFGFPLTLSLASFFEIVVGWLFAGLAIANIVAKSHR